MAGRDVISFDEVAKRYTPASATLIRPGEAPLVMPMDDDPDAWIVDFNMAGVAIILQEADLRALVDGYLEQKLHPTDFDSLDS